VERRHPGAILAPSWRHPGADLQSPGAQEPQAKPKQPHPAAASGKNPAPNPSVSNPTYAYTYSYAYSNPKRSLNRSHQLIPPTQTQQPQPYNPSPSQTPALRKKLYIPSIKCVFYAPVYLKAVENFVKILIHIGSRHEISNLHFSSACPSVCGGT